MDRYRLIGLDQMEASIVRRRLHQWSKADEEAILPLITALQEKRYLSHVHIAEPRWETNVYPLYYWAYREVGKKGACDHVLASLPNLFPTSTLSVPQEELRLHLARMVNSEIDILVEDVDYFIFIEAKEATTGQKIKFQDKGGVRQLVRQYVQGRILEKLMEEEFSLKKTFALATIGANNEQTIEIIPNPTEQALLLLIGDDKHLLKIPDLAWTQLSGSARSAGAT